MPRQPVPEPVYDAAIRTITREPLPDDEQRMAAWAGEDGMTAREMALAVIRLADAYGLAVVCRD